MNGLTRNQALELFDKISFFKLFTQEEKMVVAKFNSHIIKYDNDDYLIKQGDTDRSVYVLLQGKALVTKREKKKTILNTLKPGDIFGEVAFISERPRTTNVISIGNTIALRMDWELFSFLSETIKNKIKDKLIDVLIQRLDIMNKTLIEQVRL